MSGSRSELRAATRLLIGTTTRLERHADTVARVLHDADPAAVVAYWQYERVVVLATQRARSVGVRHLLWSAAAADLAEHARRVAERQVADARVVTAALADAQIRSVVLKGPMLAQRVYGDVGVRAPSADLDVLVDTANLLRAVDVVRDLGWGAPADPVLANGLPMHHFTLAAPDERTGVELHWRAQWYDDDAHSRGYLDRAITVDGLPVLSDADVADCVLLAWVRDGFHGVRLAADYAAALQLPDAANDAAPIDALTQARFIGRLAAHHVAATPPPTGTPRLRARIAVRAATRDRPRGTRAVTLSQSGLVDVLACDRNQIPRRMSTTWFWPTSFARWARPTAPRPLLPVFQCASALRTGWDAIVLLACRDKPPSPTQLGSVSDVKGQAGRIQT